jgi:hypothetical protein
MAEIGEPESSAEMNNRCRHATVVIFVTMLPISTIGRALAHDHQHPELNGWYESLRSGKGPCCDGTDAERVDDADWETKDGPRPVASMTSSRTKSNNLRTSRPGVGRFLTKADANGLLIPSPSSAVSPSLVA